MQHGRGSDKHIFVAFHRVDRLLWFLCLVMRFSTNLAQKSSYDGSLQKNAGFTLIPSCSTGLAHRVVGLIQSRLPTYNHAVHDLLILATLKCNNIAEIRPIANRLIVAGSGTEPSPVMRTASRVSDQSTGASSAVRISPTGPGTALYKTCSVPGSWSYPRSTPPCLNSCVGGLKIA